jgi:predicted nucleotide-binding protein
VGVASVRTHRPSAQERLDKVKSNVNEKIHRLESIRERLELIPVAAGVPRQAATNARTHTNKAFMVHGHDEAVREAVARFLENARSAPQNVPAISQTLPNAQVLHR